jgi:hypothetical protein
VLFFFLAMRKLGNRGISLLGRSRAGTGPARPLRRAFTFCVVGMSVGLVIAGAMGSQAPRTAAAATSDAASDSGSATPVADPDGALAAVGVAAPDTPVIAAFDAGSADASYGMGWRATDDKMRGGDSRVSQRLVAGGADNSAGALEVSGEIGTAIQYPFAGTSFLPNGIANASFADQGLMDYSARQTLSFQARGDGREYTLMVMGPQLDAIPAMYHFTAGPEWQQVRIPLRKLGGADLRRVKVISFGTMTPGPFRFQVDDVRID